MVRIRGRTIDRIKGSYARWCLTTQLKNGTNYKGNNIFDRGRIIRQVRGSYDH